MNTSLPSMDSTIDVTDLKYIAHITSLNAAMKKSYSSLANTVLLLPQKLLAMVGFSTWFRQGGMLWRGGGAQGGNRP